MIRKIIADGTAEKEFLKEVSKRHGETDKKVTEAVSEIIENVRNNGDKAVKEYTLKFDGRMPEYYEVPRDVINDALQNADQDFVDSLLNAMENISDFHIIRGSCNLAVYFYSACIARLICNCASLYNSGHLQIFIKSHICSVKK